jgi:hypothetical protein
VRDGIDGDAEAVEPALGDGGVLAQPAGLVSEQLGTGGGEAVVAPQSRGHHLLPVHVDQPVAAQPVQDAVERAGQECHPALRDLPDLLDHRVPVLRTGRERGEDQVGRLPEWSFHHAATLYRLPIYTRVMTMIAGAAVTGGGR